MRWKGRTSAAHNSKGIGEPKSEAAKSDTNTTCIDYRHTTIPAAICLRPYMVGPPPLAQPRQSPWQHKSNHMRAILVYFCSYEVFRTDKF